MYISVTFQVDVFLYLVKTEGIQPKNINVMSQYNAQRHAIKEKLDLAGPFDHLNVQTVVASQGKYAHKDIAVFVIRE